MSDRASQATASDRIAELQAQIDALDTTDRQHRARDFDAEMIAAVEAGNADEIEEEQALANVRARRRAAERTQLERELTSARQDAGADHMKSIAEYAVEQRPRAESARNELLSAFEKFSRAVDGWTREQVESRRTAIDADDIVQRYGVPVPDSIGIFYSAQVEHEVSAKLKNVIARLRGPILNLNNDLRLHPSVRHIVLG
ncbi:hypothetical protein [Modicisalibacter xianhensis]|uniref:Uncharacterized protein n=1 Tax=Modicisalibacter xianhensis TaxID=442341 RepID=A0A1I3GBK6_9GAMM|nr:hypothetical protein [Halomonas xianhensis]SFI20833.1 hypothetical protein SAMN04487959_12918 [Halomonas xianhensis]